MRKHSQVYDCHDIHNTSLALFDVAEETILAPSTKLVHINV